ncbi:uncharacterized protein LOC124627088 isoform X2 [Ictalurus punctatus]|uniref:Uncharacterized protein LOC124627088 isoform X2 n=1 Tax=Ictalurus punctatus TaxID=7998 RepID=A0A9F7R9P6_ICTPU|nr:uncharacterized protein LOC124627088 isoform X2 [Ictalurus punctatus]
MFYCFIDSLVIISDDEIPETTTQDLLNLSSTQFEGNVSNSDYDGDISDTSATIEDQEEIISETDIQQDIELQQICAVWREFFEAKTDLLENFGQIDYTLESGRGTDFIPLLYSTLENVNRCLSVSIKLIRKLYDRYGAETTEMQFGYGD